MNKIQCMKDDFQKAKLVYLTTFSENGQKHNRPMTNYNEDPYEMMWFPTFKNSRKVRDILKNPKTLITFPNSKKREFYVIKGNAVLENEEVVNKKWEWWYLFWLPDEDFRFRITSDAPFTNHAIINIYPESARIIKPEQANDNMILNT
ncbi:MAG: pyridoxamine 5'-phosphate oxidase family protein [Promethearchaeota archaeon]